MSQQPPSPANPEMTGTLASFRKPPVGALIFFALAALAGLGVLVRALTAKAVATCQGSAMSPGDMCEFGSRRSGDYTHDYQTRLDVAEAALHGQQLAGLLVLLAALVIIGLLLSTWRRDLRMLEGLAQERPELSHVDRGLMAPVLGGICAIALLGAGGYSFFVFQGASGFGILHAVLAAVILAGFLVLVMARPKGATALLLYPTDLAVVSRGARSRVPYSDVQHFVGDKIHSFNWAGSGRGDVMLGEDDSPPLSQVLAERTRAALAESAPQQLAQGQTLDFGEITLSRDVMTIKGKNIAMGDLAAFITATSGTDTTFEARDHSGTVLGSAVTARVANSGILRSLLADRGIAVM